MFAVCLFAQTAFSCVNIYVENGFAGIVICNVQEKIAHAMNWCTSKRGFIKTKVEKTKWEIFAKSDILLFPRHPLDAAFFLSSIINIVALCIVRATNTTKYCNIKFYCNYSTLYGIYVCEFYHLMLSYIWVFRCFWVLCGRHTLRLYQPHKLKSFDINATHERTRCIHQRPKNNSTNRPSCVSVQCASDMSCVRNYTLSTE